MLGPVQVDLVFTLARPKSLPKKVKHPAKRPDIDKLARAVLDGLTAGGAWTDDAQVIYLAAQKRYQVHPQHPTGCEIYVNAMEES